MALNDWVMSKAILGFLEDIKKNPIKLFYRDYIIYIAVSDRPHKEEK